jgi:hypothetical protein
MLIMLVMRQWSENMENTQNGLWIDWALIGVATGIDCDGNVGALKCIEPEPEAWSWVEL